MKKTSLLAGFALAFALTLSAVGSSLAASDSQSATNNAAIKNTGSISHPLNSGIGSSAVVGATGAMTSMSSTMISNGATADPMPAVTQTSVNAKTGTVNNAGTITAPTNSGNAAQAAVTAVGAGSYVSVLGVK